MKKIYSVSLPVYASVTVLVEAESEEIAENLACEVASLSDAEPIDFSFSDSEIVEVDASDCAGQEVWLSKKIKKTFPRKAF